MNDFTIGDLGVFIGTIGGVITGILIVLQKSKCRNIKCCGIQCERYEERINNNNNNNNNNNDDNDVENIVPPNP